MRDALGSFVMKCFVDANFDIKVYNNCINKNSSTDIEKDGSKAFMCNTASISGKGLKKSFKVGKSNYIEFTGGPCYSL